MNIKYKTAAQVLCPECGTEGELTAMVHQSVDVDVFADGSIENGCDFSDPELQQDEIYCGHCGTHYRLLSDTGKDYRLFAIK